MEKLRVQVAVIFEFATIGSWISSVAQPSYGSRSSGIPCASALAIGRSGVNINVVNRIASVVRFIHSLPGWMIVEPSKSMASGIIRWLSPSSAVSWARNPASP